MIFNLNPSQKQAAQELLSHTSKEILFHDLKDEMRYLSIAFQNDNLSHTLDRMANITILLYQIQESICGENDKIGNKVGTYYRRTISKIVSYKLDEKLKGITEKND